MAAPESPADPMRVFLSYARADKEIADKLRSVLWAVGSFRVASTDMLNAGEDWQSKLRDEIASSDVFIALLSPRWYSLDSKTAPLEIGIARGLRKPILPVLTQPFVQLPIELPGVKTVLLRDLEDPEYLQELLQHYRTTVPA